MFSKKQERSYMEPFFGSELDFLPAFTADISAAQSLGVDLDDYTVSSAVFSGTQRKNMLPIELDMEEESNRKCKRLKLIPPTQQCVYVSIPESPLGLTLKKTSSFLNLVESKISESSASLSMLREVWKTDAEDSLSQSNGKIKASNFSASLLRIGSWERVSRYDGELVAKCYFAKRKLVWEILDGGLKRKIEVQWSDIAALKATCENSDTQTLEIELLKQPLFFRETNPQPRKHTLWKATTDFTDEQASMFRRHFVQFPKGTLQKHFEKLLQLDDRLFSLSKRPYPSLTSAFFGPLSLEHQNLNDLNSFGFEGLSSEASKDFLQSESCHDYSQLLHCLAIMPQKHSDFDPTFASLGASTEWVGHGTSVSTSNMLPSFFLPLPSYTPNLQEGFYSLETSTGEVRTGALGDLDAAGLGKTDFKQTQDANSTLDYWISEFQNSQNLADESEDIGYRSDADEYLGRFSYVGETGHNVQDYGDCVEFSDNVPGTTPFPVFVMEGDEETSKKVEDAFEWNLWS